MHTDFKKPHPQLTAAGHEAAAAVWLQRANLAFERGDLDTAARHMERHAEQLAKAEEARQWARRTASSVHVPSTRGKDLLR